jgi:protein transport protein SEC13
MGCNAVSWAPYSGSSSMRRIAVAGCDGNVRLHYSADGDAWNHSEQPLQVSSEWVRDVAWCPAGLAQSVNATADALLLAACADDGRVTFFRQSKGAQEWSVSYLPAFKSPVWKLSWSVTGRLLAVSCGDNTVTVWKENVTGSTWQQLSSVPVGV